MTNLLSQLVRSFTQGGSDDRGQPTRSGGYDSVLPMVKMWRGTSRQVCGLFPFVSGSTAPPVGVPLGKNLDGTGTVCGDPISWFLAGLISAPNAFVLGLNGLGKSTLMRRIVVGQSSFGIHTMVLGDIKPDYVETVRELGGQIIEIGHGRGRINPLDAGNVRQAARLLPPHVAQALMQDAHNRTLTMVSSLVNIIRGSRPSDREITILDRALADVEEEFADVRQPQLADLLNAVRAPSQAVRDAALDRGDDSRYMQVTEDLEASLMALISGRFGEIFAGETTTPMMLDRSVAFDVHSLLNAEKPLQSAVLLACWNYGFASIEVAQALADAGVAPRRKYSIVMDELWRILQSGSSMVENVDSLTRLNRTLGVGQIMCTHTMKDFESLPDEHDRQRARGFIERSKMVFLGGLPGSEMPALTQVLPLSRTEQALLASWQNPGSHDPLTGGTTAPPGRGKFLLKVGTSPGLRFQVELTQRELASNDTNQRWRAA